MIRRVLVIGGAGFIGSHCKRLVTQNCDILCVDKFFTGARFNIDEILSQSGFELLRHDRVERNRCVLIAKSGASSMQFFRLQLFGTGRG